MNIYHCFPGGRYKALTMSYDDGTMHDRRLVEIFNRYGIKGTFNLNSGRLGEGQIIRPEEVATLFAGHEVATHTVTHPTIARCPGQQIIKEITEDRQGLEALVGTPVRGHAYPNGSYSDEVISIFRNAGIVYGRVTTPSNGFNLPEDPMVWKPSCHHNSPELMRLGRYLVETDRKHIMHLLYVWGHSYEFANNDNWEIIEEFCQLMGGREDIWYATNIQIIDYLDVLKRLQYFADGTAVYNPSVQSAWLEIDKSRIVEIPGGTLVDLTK